MLEELLTTTATSPGLKVFNLQSDLAAALMVRGEAKKSGLDLVRALDLAVGAAAGAIQGRSPRKEATFNRALACEQLIDGSFCRPFWQEALLQEGGPRPGTEQEDRGSGWQGEIQRHLAGTRFPAPQERWQAARVSILEAADADPRQAQASETLQNLVDARRLPVRVEVRGPILAAWGEAVLSKQGDKAAVHLRRATRLAGALQELTGDPFLSEIAAGLAAATETGDSAKLALLARGHLDYNAALDLDRTGEGDASPFFESARDAFQAADSPFRLWAELGVILTSYRSSSLLFETHEKTFNQIFEEAEAKAYGALKARAHWLHALYFQSWGQPLSMLEEYQASVKAYEALGERESAVSVEARLADALSMMGAASQSWELRHRVLKDLPLLHDPERRHYVLGSTAIAAAKEGFLDAALLLQQAALQEALLCLRTINVPVALKNLADVQLMRGEKEAAAMTLLDAQERLDESNMFSALLQFIESRIEEASGDLHAGSDPNRAAKHYRAAITKALGEEDNDRHRLPALHLKLSRAFSKLEQEKRARHQLETALGSVQEQWRSVFEMRKPGEHERELTEYFLSRREIFEELIQILVESDHFEEAFNVLEQVRARELLAMTGGFIESPLEPMTAKEIQENLPPSTTLVAYEVLSDRLVAWVVRGPGEEIEHFSRKISRAQLRRKILDLQKDFQGQASASQLRGALQDLHAWLIAPLGEIPEGETLIIVPDEELSLLPFSALLDRSTNRYLVQDHATALAPSGTLFAFSRQRDETLASRPRAGALLVGNPEGALIPLPGAEEEVDLLSNLYPEALVLKGPDATRDRFLGELSRHEVVHYAGHTQVSVLALAASPGNSPSVSSADILRHGHSQSQESRTRLLVLAACTSLGSEGSSGLELSSFARPFLGSGVPALVGSLWDIRDGNSRDLMVSFHGFLSSEADAAHALRKAQLALLETEGRPHSSLRIWAAFQLVGFTTTQREEN